MLAPGHTDSELHAIETSTASSAVTNMVPNDSIRRLRGSPKPDLLPSTDSMGPDGKYDDPPSKYKQHSNNFAILVLAGTFVAAYFVACMTLMAALNGPGVSGRIFGLMIFAAFLSTAAAILAGINAVLFTLLENEDPQKAPLLAGIPKMMYNPSISFAVCVTCLTAALYCYIFGVFFYLEKYDSFLKVPFLVLIAISLCFGLCPTFSLFVATSRYVKRSVLR